MIGREFNVYVAPRSLYTYKEKCMNDMLNNAAINPRFSFGNSKNITSADKLIAYFGTRTNLTYIYVIHDMKSGFVTNKCRRNTKESSRTQRENVGIEEKELLSWRATLEVGDEERILVSLAWCHDEDLRLATMHPFFWHVI